jgi:hypothetical protein
MKIIRFKAHLTLAENLKPIHAGFRPTLVVAARKVFCNVDELDPEPLGSGQRGTATIRIGWDSDMRCPISPGAEFQLTQADLQVAKGTVMCLLVD